METIVTYGDSLTALYPWPALIQQGADAAGAAITIVNTAVSGMASDWGLANVEANVIAYHPNAVIIEFSMNDALLSHNITPAQAAANTEAMVGQIEAGDPGVQVFLMTTNEPTAAMASTVPDLNAYLTQYRIIAQQMGIGLIDNQPGWVIAEAANPSIMADGYHPTLAADVLYEVPGVMRALGLSFPVLDPGAALAIPLADAPIALLYQGCGFGIPDLPGLNYWITQYKAGGMAALLPSFVAVMESTSQQGPMTDAQEVQFVSQEALGRPATAAEVAVWTENHLSQQQILLGIAASPEAMAHAAGWLATF